MDVGLALRNSSKGRLKYDKFWSQEGRTKEVLDKISEYSTKVSLSISPKTLSIISNADNNNSFWEKDEKKANAKTLSKADNQTIVKRIVQDAYLFELQSETESPILEYEEGRLKYIQDVFDCKKSAFENFSSELEQQINQRYLLLKRKNEMDAKRRLGELQQLENNMLEEAKNKELQQREQHQTHVKKFSAKVLEAEMKQKRAEEEMRKKEKEQQELKIQLNNCWQEAQALYTKSITKMKSCEHPQYMRMNVSERSDIFSRLLKPITDYNLKNELTIDDILDANLKVKEAYDTFQDVINDIDFAKTKAAKNVLQNSKKAVNFSFKETTSEQQINMEAAVSNSIVDTKSKDNTIKKYIDDKEIQPVEIVSSGSDTVKSKETEAKKILSQFISIDSVNEHHTIMENLKRVENLLQPLRTDPKNKKYRFELQKSVNVPINSLSANSGAQIKMKTNRLLCILSGQVPNLNSCDMTNDVVVYNFCAYMVAKQFVEQGDTQISAQHSTAFPIAMAVLGVWSKKPDVGQLILAHFYTQCPYLVPYYPPRKEKQTDIEYYKMLGYRFDDEGNLEEKYKFLNRMSGYMRLYAAIMVSPLPPNTQCSHPHGVGHAWRWLTRTVNLQPRPDITATLLYDLLQVAGSALYSAYGKQFKKLLHILCKDYFQKVKQISPGGPIERLETLLQQTVTKGRIPPPDGFLDQRFWNR